ncbi:MAG: hypothetical protein K2X29_14115, partial [Candidatus Obscuribacterales bacterium]|nr:hypothetical protein [Candidatus Obscuribacterales bacterium]
CSNARLRKYVDPINVANTKAECVEYILNAVDFINKHERSEEANQLAVNLRDFAIKLNGGNVEGKPCSDSDPRSLTWPMKRAIDYLLIQERNDEAKLLTELFIKAATAVLGRDSSSTTDAWMKYNQLHRLLGQGQNAASYLVPRIKVAVRTFNRTVNGYKQRDWDVEYSLGLLIETLKESGTASEAYVWTLEDYKAHFQYTQPADTLAAITDEIVALSQTLTEDRRTELTSMFAPLESMQKKLISDWEKKRDEIFAELLSLPDPVLEPTKIN